MVSRHIPQAGLKLIIFPHPPGPQVAGLEAQPLCQVTLIMFKKKKLCTYINTQKKDF